MVASIAPFNVPTVAIPDTSKLPVISIFPVPVINLLFRSRFPPSCGVVSPTTSDSPPLLIVTVAVPPVIAAATPLPTKLIVPAVPTADPSSLTTTPDPEPTTPVSPDPSPLNCVAVTIPVTFTPSEFAHSPPLFIRYLLNLYASKLNFKYC